ncbi:MaoC/PaaZ C-terminal domain-containing protein [Micromonospora sp. 4G57]|uniref:MaoC/PaaZ C-terminal domain-containing protein n=1 Tax=Micromonospora sicca TaxID=2202420 RepID=A0ABU5JLE9_9ACTN|nr:MULTISPECIES: MaoC/PaaZ C-terminal domain-containing protein [unclassified Micromonospora]MDZ5446359.1 MaoC/PaaZ C-terminal domain-containing protein [Micromonospora sp. 4G57]MDZ5493452.1 MaoC/PaaZ C-terminal domain-containing protein [Micromonospora sp. 4G53]
MSWTYTRGDLLRYAAASLDLNDIHQDDEAARKAGFDGVIAHGMLTLGRVLAALPGPLQSCSARFTAPVPLGVEVSVDLAETEPTKLAGTVKAGSVKALTLQVSLGPPNPAAPLTGELVSSRVLVVERGPARKFAEAVGFAGEIAPSHAYALPNWGWFPDKQTSPGPAPDAVGDCRAWTGTKGAVVHGRQSFEWHRDLHIGEEVVANTYVLDRKVRPGNSGTMTITTVAQRITDATGDAVLTATSALLTWDDR